MIKIDWNDAPDWARYFAFDEDGQCGWYENEPRSLSRSWVCDGKQTKAYISDWRDSVEERPRADKNVSEVESLQKRVQELEKENGRMRTALRYIKETISVECNCYEERQNDYFEPCAYHVALEGLGEK